MLWDTQQLNAAIAALEAKVPKPAAALTAIENVGTMWYGLQVSHQVYTDWLALRAPGYERLTWGAQGQRAMEPGLSAEYGLIEQSKYADALATLKPLRDAEVDDLNARLAAMADTARSLAKQVDALK